MLSCFLYFFQGFLLTFIAFHSSSRFLFFSSIILYQSTYLPGSISKASFMRFQLASWPRAFINILTICWYWFFTSGLFSSHSRIFGGTVFILVFDSFRAIYITASFCCDTHSSFSTTIQQVYDKFLEDSKHQCVFFVAFQLFHLFWLSMLQHLVRQFSNSSVVVDWRPGCSYI